MDTTIVVKAKVSEDGSSLFGSVTNAVCPATLSKLGFDIDRIYIKLAPSTIIKTRMLILQILDYTEMWLQA